MGRGEEGCARKGIVGGGEEACKGKGEYSHSTVHGCPKLPSRHRARWQLFVLLWAEKMLGKSDLAMAGWFLELVAAAEKHGYDGR